MAINKRERTLLIATITIVVVGVNYFLITWIAGPWQERSRTLLTKKKELAAMKSTIAKQTQWQQDYDGLRQSLNQSSQFETISDVLKKIDELTGSTGISMQSKRSLKPSDHESYRDWPVSCNFEATIESLVKFLYGLQTGSGFITVEQLNVTAKPDNQSILRCDNVQIRALAAKEGKPAS
ncbi:MAG: type 4a pilus biogenesis protein PilO [Verrucomicrobiota bacterium]